MFRTHKRRDHIYGLCLQEVQASYTEGTELIGLLIFIAVLLLFADIGILCLMLMMAAIVSKLDKTS